MYVKGMGKELTPDLTSQPLIDIEIEISGVSQRKLSHEECMKLYEMSYKSKRILYYWSQQKL